MQPPIKKRKAINDFFIPIAKSHKTSNVPVHIGSSCDNNEAVLGPQKTPVPGLTIYHDFISPAEEASLLAFLNDPSKCTWRTDLSRRTMHFGGSYCLMPSKASSPSPTKPQILQAPSIPNELNWILQRMVDNGIFPPNQKPQYCIVNEYTGSLGISAHTENFQFSEPVVGLSLLSTCPIRFHELLEPYDGSVRSGKAGKARKTGRVADVEMPARSLLVMSGQSRWRWQHEIVRNGKGRGLGWKRVSLTFRYKCGQDS